MQYKTKVYYSQDQDQFGKWKGWGMRYSGQWCKEKDWRLITRNDFGWQEDEDGREDWEGIIYVRASSSSRQLEGWEMEKKRWMLKVCVLWVGKLKNLSCAKGKQNICAFFEKFWKLFPLALSVCDLRAGGIMSGIWHGFFLAFWAHNPNYYSYHLLSHWAQVTPCTFLRGGSRERGQPPWVGRRGCRLRTLSLQAAYPHSRADPSCRIPLWVHSHSIKSHWHANEFMILSSRSCQAIKFQSFWTKEHVTAIKKNTIFLIRKGVQMTCDHLTGEQRGSHLRLKRVHCRKYTWLKFNVIESWKDLYTKGFLLDIKGLV